jgi:PST family polysaccharide transporter
MGLIIAPVMIGSYLIGLPHGPKGVAFAYSTVMMLLVIPIIAWSVNGTVISLREILLAVSRPLASSIVAGALAFEVRLVYGRSLSPLAGLVLESAVLLVTFVGMLLFASGQKALYLGLLRGLRGPSSAKEGEGVA